MPFEIDGKQISPCIIAKAKYALGITTKKPRNNKTCSPEYWERIVLEIGTLNNLPKDKINDAIKKVALVTPN